MKILYLANIRLPTEKAHGLQIMETCAAFAAAGHEVTLAVSSWESAGEAAIFAHYKLKKNFEIKNISGVALHSWGGLGYVVGTAFFLFNAKRALDISSFDAVYTREAMYVSQGAYYEMHDVREGPFQKRAFKRASGIVAISNGLAEYCRTHGVPAEKIVVAHDAVDLKAFSISEDKASCRTRVGLPADKKIALYAGHLYSWKGADVLAQVAAYMSEDVAVAFVGGTDHDIAAFRSRYGSIRNIIIVGHQPHELMPYYLHSADALVLPNSAKQDISRLYTSPLKLFEYMASGVPIVASDLPSIREVLNEDNAVLCAPDEPASLARSVQKILNDRVLASRLSSAALRDVQSHTWGDRAATILDFIAHTRI